ncbi:Kinase [Hexamita inflata]|uniref:CAMK CAMKL n=1 Tax=Hexamita inflata TaxID=28002 RepID=A0AA86QQH3_9EUKA|nr:CAMK CAMKL [Hexamita inflata]
MKSEHNSKLTVHNNDVFVKNYKIVSKIDEGCEAAVFKARNVDNKFVALYHISNRARALNRIQIHQVTNNIKGVVQMLDHFQIQESNAPVSQQFSILQQSGTIIVFAYVDGKSIDKCLLKQNRQTILDAIRQLTLIIDQLHKFHVFHLDIKPDNIYYCNGSVIVLDLGSSQQIHSSSQKIEPILHLMFGPKECLTKVFESTKYFRSERDIQKQCIKPIVAQKYDVYSIGCLTYYLLTSFMIRTSIQRMSYHAHQLRQKFGENVTDLLCGMLDENQYVRFTTQQILRHSAMNDTSLRLFTFQYLLDANSRISYNEKKYNVRQRSKSIAQSKYEYKFREQNQQIIDDQHPVYYDMKFYKLFTENVENLNTGSIFRVANINKENHTCLEQGRHLLYNRYLQRMHIQLVHQMIGKQFVHKLKDDKQELSCAVTTDTTGTEILDDSESESQYQVHDNIDNDMSLTVVKTSRRNTIFNVEKTKSPLTLQPTQINTEFSIDDIFGDIFQVIEMSVSNNSRQCFLEEEYELEK